MAAGAAADAHVLAEDLVPDIVQGLRQHGAYRTTLDPRQPQRLVDVRWAALGAGRQLGRGVQVVMSRAVETREAPITVLVTFVAGPRPRSIPAQRQR